MSRKLLGFVGALLVALIPSVASAQSGTSAISGTVRDSSGIGIPGAIVRIVNEDNQSRVEAVTNTQGAYRAAELAPGRYRVEAIFDGFETAVRRQAVDAGQTAAVDVALVPERVTEGVVVTARRVEEDVQQVPIPVSVLGG